MRKMLGLVLGSGAARGWAHIGVLRGLEEIRIRPDVIAGCSVGALVGGAYLAGALEALEAWARELKPLSALRSFAVVPARGGLIDAAPAFRAFSTYDRPIEDLNTRFGAVAADLATGEEVWLTRGSLLDAVRASSAIPLLFHAVRHERGWLVDGALVNPAPVSLARNLGADVVISVDLNATPRVLDRFSAATAAAKAPASPTDAPDADAPGVSAAIAKLIASTRKRVAEQAAAARARTLASPQLLETAYAAADIFQMQLARARAIGAPADVYLAPDMRDATATSFDRADEFIAEGRRALMGQRAEIEALLA